MSDLKSVDTSRDQHLAWGGDPENATRVMLRAVTPALVTQGRDEERARILREAPEQARQLDEGGSTASPGTAVLGFASWVATGSWVSTIGRVRSDAPQKGGDRG
jgi:hypothetical protein